MPVSPVPVGQMKVEDGSEWDKAWRRVWNEDPGHRNGQNTAGSMYTLYQNVCVAV